MTNTDVSPERERLLAATFVEMVTQLVSGFDVIDALTVLTSRGVELLDTDAAGILLSGSQGRLSVVAASSEEMRLLELFQLQNDEGPCLDSFRSGAIVSHLDLRDSSPWPRFAERAVDAGFTSVCAVPLRLEDDVLGCLNLFMSERVSLPQHDVEVAQALADVASITVVHDEALRQAQAREQQLQHALNSRIVIEQAKGMIAERGSVDMHEAFDRLRTYSRNHNARLSAVATALTTGEMPIDDVL